MEQRRFEVLDAWRGICALLVVSYHIGFAGHFYGLAPVRNGHLGVDFFFVLSGFVIAHSSFRKILAGGYFSEFMLRRFARIYPLHLITLLALVSLELLKLIIQRMTNIDGGENPFSGASSLPALAANIFLLNGLGFFDEFTWNGPSWSISTEFYTYIFFAIIAISFRQNYKIAALSIVCLASVLLIWNAGQPHPRTVVQGVGLLECIQEFFLGTLTYVAHRRWRLRIAWLEPVALALVAAAFFGVVPGWATCLVFALFVFVFAPEAGPISPFFRARIFIWLGMVSYSIYLVHYPVVTTVNALFRVLEAKSGMTMFGAHDGEKLLLSVGGSWAMDLLGLAIVFIVCAVAALSYRWIERPAERWLRSYSPAPRPGSLVSAPPNPGAEA
jgi:peptidoglycan/LPS O-acetylase OafA/YrhL